MRLVASLPFLSLLVAPSVAHADWHPGDPVPRGYHVEEGPNTGLITAGITITAIPYLFSVIAAASADSANESGWLYVPVAGPWLTLGRRQYPNHLCADPSTGESFKCVGEIFLMMGLILDGAIQAAGATVTIIGVASRKEQLVSNDEAVRLTPMQVGTGYGAGVVGSF